jgi:hypothetical protein
MEKIEVSGATVDFFKKEEEGITVFSFDTSSCQPPEPMVNGMCGLQLIKESKQRLEMTNHKAPLGLFPKIEADFNYEVIDLDDNGKVKVIFTKKEDANNSTDFTQNTCSG